jgi:hypothetical protein
VDLFSPPKMAATLLALVTATAVTWVYSGHRTLPLPQEPSPVAAAFAEIDRTIVPVQIKVTPVKKTASAELFLDGTTSPPPKPRSHQAEEPERHDVCAKYGGHRVEHGRHGWRCVYPDGRHRHHRRRR